VIPALRRTLGTLVLTPAVLTLTAVAAGAEPKPKPSASLTDPSIQIQLPGAQGSGPGTAVTLLIALTVLSIAPAVLLMTTAFTKIVVVLSLTRNALGVMTAPPNQVLAGLALFLSLFIMGPVLTDIKEKAVDPYMSGDMTFSQAYDKGSKPLHEFMLKQTRQEDLALMIKASGQEKPANPASVTMTTLVPAFMISELRAAFIIGFVIFIPFLIIDMLVGATLMSVGMMMVPPAMIALPFKLLMFVLVDGWGLIVTALVGSYR
jgi:flagellar biosynthesis protein FliP